MDDALAPPGARLRGTHRLLRSDDPRRSRKSPAPAHRSQIGVLKRTLSGVPYNHFSNILIDSNLAIRQTDPKLSFPLYLQGIDACDEEWTNVTVTNNVVVTSACWGIFYASVHNSKIINNTVLADGLLTLPGNCKPAVTVGDKTHQGPSSSDVIIRNNIANKIGRA